MKKNIKSIGLGDPEKLYAFVEQHLAPKEYEKKEFGEVFTPLWLVEQMLNEVPDEVWQDPKTKILDPAAGIGNFPIIAYKKLMEGLKNKIKDESKRKRHILENMLYMVELNPVNSGIMNRLLGGNTLRKKDGYDLNIVTDSFFHKDKEEKKKLVPKNKKIDLAQISYTLVMGNPPYSEGSGNIGNSIWQKFVRNSILLIKEKGFLSFVHPPLWRKPEKPNSNNLYNLLAYDRTPLYIEMHDSKDGIKTFNSGTRYDWYVIKNIANNGYESRVRDITGKLYQINMCKYSWLPNTSFAKIFNITTKLPKIDNSRVIHGSQYTSSSKWVSLKLSEQYKYTLIHGTTKEGTKCMYSSRNDKGLFDKNKVIFGSASDINNPVIDLKGEYGMTQHAMAIPVQDKKDAIILINYLKTEEFKKILDQCQFGNYGIDPKLFMFFKDGFWRDKKIINNDINIKPLSCISWIPKYKNK